MAMQPAKDDSYPTRSSLLNRLKNTQDHSSWQTFNDIYGRLIFRFAIKNGLTEDEAEEVVQETLIGVAKYLPNFRYDPKVCAFKTWLLNLSRWRIQNQLRQRRAPSASGSEKAHGNSEEEATNTSPIERIPSPASGDFEALWDREWRATLMDAALARVKPLCSVKQWQIFDLHVLQEWSVGEVNGTLGVSAGRVYLAKHRISVLLRKELKRLEQTSLGVNDVPGK